MKKYFVASFLSIILIVVSTALILSTRQANATGAAWHIDNVATGSNNGTSWVNAWQSFAAINWASIQPGDTIYISGGAISKTYNEAFTVGKSGTLGNPITVTTGQDAGHNGMVIIDGTDTQQYGFYIDTKSYVVISGQLGSNSAPNMLVKNHTIAEARPLTVKGLEIKYIEMGPNKNPNGAQSVCIRMGDYSGGGNRIHHNTLHDCYKMNVWVEGSAFTFQNADYLRIDHNNIYGSGNDLIHTGAGAGGLTIDHNDVHEPSNDAVNHSPDYSDGMQLRGFQWVTVAYNKIYNMQNTGGGMYAYIYLEADPTQSNVVAHDVSVYNNIIYENHSITALNTGGLVYACKTCVSSANIKILNNTIVDTGQAGLSFTPGAGTITNAIVANNIIYNPNRPNTGSNRYSISLQGLDAVLTPTTGSFGDSPTPDIIWDYNLVDLSSAGTIIGWYGPGGGVGNQYTYSNWKNACHCNAHDSTADPVFVNWSEGNSVDLHLASGDAAAKDKGTARIELSDDYDGNSRPQGSAWDIGAYEYIQAPPPLSALKGDFNADSKVNSLDFTQFKNAFKSLFNAIFDLNSDSAIDVKDLGVLMSGWLE